MRKMSIRVALLLSALALSCPVACGATDSGELESETEEMSADAVQIDSGSFYEAVTEVWPDVVIYDYQDGSCGVDISAFDSSVSNMPGTYLWICGRLIGASGFADYYDSMSVSYFDDDVLAFIRVYDYVDLSDFTTYFFGSSVGDSATNYAALALLYNSHFYNFDHETKEHIAFNDIVGEEYYEIEEKTVDYFWLFSCFPVNAPYKISEEKAVVNYVGGFTDSYESGYYIWNQVEAASKNYNRLRSVGAGFSFDTIDIVCKDDEGNFLFGIDSTNQSDGSWVNNVFNLYDTQNFAYGIVAADEEE